MRAAPCFDLLTESLSKFKTCSLRAKCYFHKVCAKCASRSMPESAAGYCESVVSLQLRGDKKWRTSGPPQRRPLVLRSDFPFSRTGLNSKRVSSNGPPFGKHVLEPTFFCLVECKHQPKHFRLVFAPGHSWCRVKVG